MLVRTMKELETAVEEAAESRYLAVDVETTGLDRRDSDVIGVGWATKKCEWYFDFPTLLGTPESKGAPWQYEKQHVWERFKYLFNPKRCTLVSHNTSFDMYFLDREMANWTEGSGYFAHSRGWWDTMQMAALIDENLIGVRVDLPGEGDVVKPTGALSLKALSRIFLGRTQRLWDETFDKWTIEEQAEYGCADVRNTYDLAILFSKHLKRIKLLNYYERFVAPMSFVTCMMETAGIKVDIPALLKVQESITEELAQYVGYIGTIMPPQRKAVIDLNQYGPQAGAPEEDTTFHLLNIVSELTPEEAAPFLLKSGKVSVSKSKLAKLKALRPDKLFWTTVTRYEEEPTNPNSGPQLAAYLEGKGYRLPVTGTGRPSVSAEVIAELSKDHPDELLWEPLLKMRKLAKLKSTYVDACLNMAWEDDTVHPQWNQAGTATGRYSCSSDKRNNKNLAHKRGPALQTIPRPDTIESAGWAYNPREWFIAHPGNVLCVADLSQAEVRMMAVMSQDPDLATAIFAGEDTHASMAEKVMGEAWEKADAAARKVMRTHIKQVTFGAMYGIGAGKLSERLNIAFQMARDLLHDYYAAFAGVLTWKHKEAVKLSRTGYVTSYLGRRRSPVLIQDPPRVTARPGNPKYARQQLQLTLWQAEFDMACRKSKFDIETVEEHEKKGRAERQAINFMIQGSVAELINYGLWRLVKGGYTVRGQIHDEVIVEIPDTEGDRRTLCAVLEAVYNVTIQHIPFKVDIHFGPSWAAGKE